MRSDHVLALNADTTAFAERLAGHIKTREEELSGLRKLHNALLTAAEHDVPALPSFVNAQDEGFKRVAEAADIGERRNGRPVIGGMAETASAAQAA